MKTLAIISLVFVWLLVGISYHMAAVHKDNPRMRYGWVRFRYRCMLVHTSICILYIFL